jgi:DNA-directed RNA polymerase specialized sigma24 family protein
MRPADADIEAAYVAALAYAAQRVRKVRGPDSMREAATDAATSGVMWAVRRFDPAQAPRGFGPFCAAAVRRWVWRGIRKHVLAHRNRPAVVSYDALPGKLGEHLETVVGMHSWAGEWLVDRKPNTGELTEAIEGLPPDLRDAVRFFYIDGYSQRDAALLCGCSQFLFRERLIEAARRLGLGLSIPRRATGKRRLVRPGDREASRGK